MSLGNIDPKSQKRKKGTVAQMVECLPNKCEALSSIPSITKKETSQEPVAHTFNSSNSGGRNQEDHGLKPARANSWQDPVS
jgi:hypothetical protein